VAWLNGVMSPTIVSADPAPDTLGFILKGWMAWGCRNAEKQTMVWNEVA